MAKLSTILDQIDNGSLVLPEFQRGYVWNREQVRSLMSSVYRAYPVGSFLVWETRPTTGLVRGDTNNPGSTKRLLLDGQQRITSLYGIARGVSPPFFEGDSKAFTGLYFNVEEESFEFYAPAKMQSDTRWINVSALFAKGAQALIDPMTKDSTLFERAWRYMERLTRLRSVLDRDFHEELITGPGITVDDVVDIFNRVNSGGTKLSKGDLALAKICADWPDARAALRKHLAEWHGSGYDFSLDWLLRNVNVVATGRAPFSAFDQVEPELFRSALSEAAAHIGRFLEAARGRLGLDHDRVLMGRYATPVVTLLLKQANGKFEGAAIRDKILFWYVQSAIWGRFAGSTETVLARDYEVASTSGIDGLIAELEQWRGGNLTLGSYDFEGSTRGSRFYPLLYLLTRAGSAKDFGSGLELRHEMLGKLSSLQIHHIFPKAVLYKAGYSQGATNAIANFSFLTQDTNLQIGAELPSDYLKEM